MYTEYLHLAELRHSQRSEFKPFQSFEKRRQIRTRPLGLQLLCFLYSFVGSVKFATDFLIFSRVGF